MKNKLNENPNAMIPPNEWEKYKDNPKKSSYQPSPIHYDENNNIPFGYLKDGTLIIGKYSSIHDTIGKGKERLGRSKNSGRIFTNYKVITFWNFPSNYNELIKVIKDLENKTKLNILNDPEWLIEIPSGEFKKALEDEDIKSWGSWRPKIIDQKFIPIKDYKGGYTRSKEEMEIDHVKSPLLKQKTTPHGYGSKNPKYKPLALRQAMYAESYTPILNENPNEISYDGKFITWGIEKSVITFGEYEGQLFSSDDPDMTHQELAFNFYEKQYKKLNHETIQRIKKKIGTSQGRIGVCGRVFIKHNIITFWIYPNKEELNKLVRYLNKNYNLNISEDEWLIESPNENYIYIKDYDNYNRPESELNIQHNKSPLEKQNKSVPQGVGSKRYLEKKPLELRQAMYAESYYPILKSDLLNGD